MAINIFQGGASKSKGVNSASNSARAQQAKNALAQPAETSSSGSTAVGTKNVMGKIGNTVGKIANVASKFLPGLGGTIAKGVASIFNDPEWWQSVPGDALTTNAPLMPVSVGTYEATGAPLETLRAVMLECYNDTTVADGFVSVFVPNDQMITQYLMPQIRKVVNAVPLQSATAYRRVLQAQATLYALWRNLRKYDYMLKHGQTYIPNLNVDAFPVLQVDNAAWLQSTINRLEEYLRANVRLPHTLCEYLAWRFGRAYRMNDAAKSGVVLYNVRSLNTSISSYNDYIQSLMNFVSSYAELQQANTDIYNAYYDHDIAVEIRDDTQMHYDKKEFMLRTNLDVLNTYFIDKETYNPIYMDSGLDNPTTYMASTVSTVGKDMSGNQSVLFPVDSIAVYTKGTHFANNAFYKDVVTHYSEGWQRINLSRLINLTVSAGSKIADYACGALTALALCKTTELYNKNLYFMSSYLVSDDVDGDEPEYRFYDLTSISMDMGTVSDEVLGNEHVYAFANLIDVERKASMSYKQAEKLVARDVANMVETVDIATAGTPTTPATGVAGK